MSGIKQTQNAKLKERLEQLAKLVNNKGIYALDTLEGAVGLEKDLAQLGSARLSITGVE
jgi:hypothetical protein